MQDLKVKKSPPEGPGLRSYGFFAKAQPWNDPATRRDVVLATSASPKNDCGIVVVGRAEASPKHSTLKNGSTWDDQNSCRISGVCHHRNSTENRWCLKAKVCRITGFWLTFKSLHQESSSSSDDERPQSE